MPTLDPRFNVVTEDFIVAVRGAIRSIVCDESRWRGWRPDLRLDGRRAAVARRYGGAFKAIASPPRTSWKPTVSRGSGDR